MKLFGPRFSSRVLCYLILCCPVLVGLVMTVSAFGQSTRPGSISDESRMDQTIENESLQPGKTASKPAALRATGAAAGTSSASDLVRVVLALAIVISVILLLRTGIRRMASLPGGARAGKLVTVLSRSMISPRQQILVLQVGKRLLVVGDSGGAMNQLCELTDPDEIAALIGQTRQSTEPSSDRKISAFGSLFRRATGPFNETQTTEEPTEEPAENQSNIDPVSVEEVGGLMDKIRMLQQQYKVKAE